MHARVYKLIASFSVLNQIALTLVLTFMILMVQPCSHTHARIYEPMCRIASYIMTVQIQYACMAHSIFLVNLNQTTENCMLLHGYNYLECLLAAKLIDHHNSVSLMQYLWQ